MKVIAVTQARTGSTRLPRKVLMNIQEDKTLLGLHLERVLKSTQINELILATTTSEEDKSVVEIGNLYGVRSFCGSENDVLDRFYQALQGTTADYIVRLTADCPLIDAALIDRIISFTISNNLDYASNTLDPTYPDGQDVEVFRYTALKRAWNESKLISEREHVTPYIWKNSSYKEGTLFTSKNFFSDGKSFGHLRLTVDEQVDFDVIKKIVEELGANRTWIEYATYLEKNESLMTMNNGISRNEGYQKSLRKE